MITTVTPVIVVTYFVSYLLLTLGGAFASDFVLEPHPDQAEAAQGYMPVYDSWHLYGTYSTSFSGTTNISKHLSLSGDGAPWGLPKLIQTVYWPLLVIDRRYWHPGTLIGKWIS